jgi:hypothetical protein
MQRSFGHVRVERLKPGRRKVGSLPPPLRLLKIPNLAPLTLASQQLREIAEQLRAMEGEIETAFDQILGPVAANIVNIVKYTHTQQEEPWRSTSALRISC